MLGAVNWGHDRGCIYVSRGRAVESGPFFNFIAFYYFFLSFHPALCV